MAHDDYLIYTYLYNDVIETAAAYSRMYTRNVGIEKVIFNDPATIVLWTDNTKTVVKAINEKFDPEKGLAMAIAKKYYGNEGNYFNHLKKWLKDIPTSATKTKKSRYKIGDKISIDLEGTFGTQTATAQKVNEDGSVIFLFDNILVNRPMNRRRFNQGGFYKSDLNFWIKNTLLPAFPKGIQICEISIPTYGQIFGHDKWYGEVFVSDHDEQWLLMKQQENRRAKHKNYYDGYWLQNAAKRDYLVATFALSDCDGNEFYDGASYYNGVRPCFTIEPPHGDK